MYRSPGKTVAILLGTALLSLAAAGDSLPQVPEKLLVQARSGDAQAQLELGYTYYKLKDPARAAFWFDAAARKGIPEAQCNLAYCYLRGSGVEKNLHKAFELLKQAAAADLIPAQLVLAELYLSGIPAVPDAAVPRAEIPANEKAAQDILEKLIRKGVLDANTTYAGYLIKKYPEQEKFRIIELLNAPAEKGHPAAQLMLAGFLISRKDALRDEKRALQLLESAAKKSPEAMVQLAYAVENGYGAAPDPEKAFTLYAESMKKTFVPQAAVRLANYYYTGHYGVRQDVPRAIDLYRKAAEAGVSEALYKLGECYYRGIGVTQDCGQAFELFLDAAQSDYPPAQFALGRCFAEGKGTPADQSAAFYWFNQAAMRYEPQAMLEVGKRYLEGKGTAKDPTKAAAFLQQAYANGMSEAAQLLKKAVEMPEESVPQARPTPVFTLQKQ